MNQKTAVILAAGQGTRMKSEKPKVLHEVCGKPMVSHVISQVRKAGIDDIVVVIGHGADRVQDGLKGENVTFAVQKEQLGTGHAVMQAMGAVPENGGVFVLCGDTPLITAESLRAFSEYHENSGCDVTVLTAKVEDPTGYGRIIRNAEGGLLRIVEQKDASEEEKAVNEINSGMYVFDAAFLRENIDKLDCNNAQKEYYITDLITMAVEQGRGAAAVTVADVDEIMGVNDRVQLARATKVMRKRIAEKHMRAGVTIIDPDSVYIEDSVEIGPDTVVWPGAELKGNTKIGSGVLLGRDTIIENSIIGDGTDILKSVIKDSEVGSRSHIGPFAYLRPGNKIGDQCKVGDFVEFKNSTFGNGSKAGHLAYVGDADLGEDINIGCGVIFVNYDGKKKYRSKAGDRAFIGSNSNIVAPVELEEDAYIAAGSTVTKNVKSGALFVERAKGLEVEGWVERKGLKREPGEDRK